MVDDKAMHARWLCLCKDLNVSDEQTNEWWQFIDTYYQEPTRYYHTLAHIEELFEYRDRYIDKLREPSLVDLAIWFHDIIYEPEAKPGKNEDDSAIIFRRFAEQISLNIEQREKVFDWIVATKHHKSESGDNADFRLFLDMDMAILGKPWDIYFAYSKKVKLEYSHIPMWKWCIGRAQFITTTLNQKRIFATQQFFEDYEVQARTNLRQELYQLQSDLADSLHIPSWLAYLLISLAMSNFGALAKFFICNCIIMFMLTIFTSWSVFLLGFINFLLCVFLLIRAPVISFPYTDLQPQTYTVVQAGSFNPPHQGHIELVKFLSQKFQHVYLVVGANPNKTYPVSPQQRKALLEKVCAELELTNVTAHIWSDYIWRFVYSMGATYLIRGIRSWGKDGMEEKFLEALNHIGPTFIGGILPYTTLYIKGDPALATFSSSLVRETVKDGGTSAPYVHPCIKDDVDRLYS